jgi:hypothetical protein
MVMLTHRPSHIHNVHCSLFLCHDDVVGKWQVKVASRLKTTLGHQADA